MGEINICLDITDEQFKKFKIPEKLDILYVNQKQTLKLLGGMERVKRYQKMQWWSISALFGGICWLFVELWLLVSK